MSSRSIATQYTLLLETGKQLAATIVYLDCQDLIECEAWAVQMQTERRLPS